MSLNGALPITGTCIIEENAPILSDIENSFFFQRQILILEKIHQANNNLADTKLLAVAFHITDMGK